MIPELATWFGVAVALFWLWYPDREYQRRKQRNAEVERQMKRVEFAMRGIDIEDRAAVQEMIDDFLQRHR